MRNRLIGFSFLFLLLTYLSNQVSAQTSITATINALDTQAFPRMEAYLDVFDSDGNFVFDLLPDQVHLIEDNETISITNLRLIRPGVQFAVAISTGPALGKRNNKGISRYELVIESLRHWAKSRIGSTLDDWSLIITYGPVISHTTQAPEWLAILDSDTVDARSATPSLDCLARGIELVSDPLARPGMGRAVLFITPPPEERWGAQLENLTAQATDQGIPIFVWMVAPDDALSVKAAGPLVKMAKQTGGTFIMYTGEETLQDLETYLEPLRYTYLVEYQSVVKTNGAHWMAVQLQSGIKIIESNQQEFNIQIQPPQPAFVSPPIQIRRLLLPNEQLEDAKALTTMQYSPAEQVIQVVFDFRDGHKRPIVHSILYVDSIPVDENKVAPFDQFNWQLSGFTSSGVHQLYVQATDASGLTGKSIEIPVSVIVEEPVSNLSPQLSSRVPVLLGIVVVMACVAWIYVKVSRRQGIAP
jgi:hypothetical protein